MSRPLSDLVATLPQDGVFSWWLGPVSGPPASVREESVTHYAASTMKLFVLVAAHRAADAGDIDLDAPVTVHDDFSSAADGSTFRMDQDYDNDDEVWAVLGSGAPLRWLVERMIVRSSNLATNLVLERVGMAGVQETLSALESRESTVTRGIEDVVAREAGLTNEVSARDLATTLQAIAGGAAASPVACEQIRATLAAQELRDTIPAGLPAGVQVAHKSGWVDGITHDAGIVLPPPEQGDPFILVVCTTSDLSEEDGRKLVARTATAAWQDWQEQGCPA